MKAIDSAAALPNGVQKAARSAANGDGRSCHAHVVRFYESDDFLAGEVASFVAAGLNGRDRSVIIATAEHCDAFAGRLGSLGFDVDAARRAGRLRMLDARELLPSIMAADVPDEERFRAVIGGVLEQAIGGEASDALLVYGELVDLLWKEGNAAGAIKLEEMWNRLAEKYSFKLLCGYAMENFPSAADTGQFQQICRLHSHVLPTERFAAADEAGLSVEISVLQQRARALETELEHRGRMEKRLRDSLAERRVAERALQDSERKLRDFLEGAAEGIHLVGPNGIIMWANQAELDMLGYASEEYIGHHIADFHVDRPVIDDLLARLSRGETLREQAARMRHRDGSVRYVQINSNVQWDAGKFVNTRCFTRDITPLKEAETERELLLVESERARREAEAAWAEAQAANRAKNEFLAVMSHELRTPLNAIGGYAELIEIGVRGPVTPEQRDDLRRIQTSQRHLLGLINEVLNYARLESGSVAYDLCSVSVRQALAEAEALVAPQARAKGLSLAITDDSRDVEALADPEKLRQVLVNLLSNAVKFTERGGRLELSCAGEQDVVRVQVRDTGIGIPADKLEAIFDPFVQVRADFTRPHEGTGLGLAISRDLARGMGGELKATSKVGVGSTFTLVLPRA